MICQISIELWHPDGQMDENGIKEHQDDMSDINRTVHPDEQMGRGMV